MSKFRNDYELMNAVISLELFSQEQIDCDRLLVCRQFSYRVTGLLSPQVVVKASEEELRHELILFRSL